MDNSSARQSRSLFAGGIAPAARFLSSPPRWLEAVLWMCVLASTLGIRLYLIDLVPAYLWSNDTGSYAYSVFHWLNTGDLVFDGRRGPVYTLFIAAAIKATGSVNGVMWAQHALGAAGVLFLIAAARAAWGRKAAIPLLLCGISYGLYGLPISLEHLLRNETLLFFFSSISFGCWLLAFRFESGWLFFAASLSAGLLTLTKNVFLPFPVILAIAILLTRYPVRRKLTCIMAVVLGFLLPPLAYKTDTMTIGKSGPPQPQEGILFYGRTAQWTFLDGGIEPELKALIRQDVEDYRALPALNNNIVIKRTIIPHIKQHYTSIGKSDVDLNKVCRRLACEAVWHQPAAWARQILGDLYKLHFKSGVENGSPSPTRILESAKVLSGITDLHPSLEQAKMVSVLQKHADKKRLRHYYTFLSRSWLFQGFPCFFTSLFLPVLIWRCRGDRRLLAIGLAVMWSFTMVLLSTVGRPLERYLLPVTAVTFLTLTLAIVLFWEWSLGKILCLQPVREDADGGHS